MSHAFVYSFIQPTFIEIMLNIGSVLCPRDTLVNKIDNILETKYSKIP